MKKSELRELVAKWKDLKRRSKNHDLSEKIRLIEHQYYHETGRRLEDELDGRRAPRNLPTHHKADKII